MSLANVKTVILLMMENRSFDHMLGHLSLERINTEVNGLRRPLRQYDNIFNGSVFPAFRMQDGPLPFDPPHEHTDIAVQMDFSPVTQTFTMGGFVRSFADAVGAHPGPRPVPMGYLPSNQVPITSFLARNYCTCDAWFSPLPTSTQPNRTLAFCGSTAIHDTRLRLIPTSDTIFDWMKRADVRWRVYHDGLSYFALYPRVWDDVLGDGFRDFEFMFHDLSRDPTDSDPQVIIVEPTYADAPHFGSDHPNDNHAPLAVGWGEEFLRRVYEAVTANRSRWESTVLIVYYDEHGGFWDHVSPPRIPYTTSGSDPFEFASLGPRIPAIVVSPLVEAGSVSHATMDHTSVLQFLAERFTPGGDYSDAVSARTPHITSVSTLLTRDSARTDTPPAPATPIRVTSALGASIATMPASGMEASFELAARRLLAEHPTAVAHKYPELFQWQAAVSAARRQ